MNRQTILLTGADGYLGWPIFLRLSRSFPDATLVGVDNFARRKWVEEVGGISALPIASMEKRLLLAKEFGYQNLEFIDLDLTNYADVKKLIRSFEPDIILHTAAQPSAPYSHLNAEKAEYTQHLNMASTRNLLWALRECGLKETHFIETTTTGIYGAPGLDIPEGKIKAIGPDGRHDWVPYPNMATSWYHVSKGFNATNMQLMNFQIGLPVTDIRTSIIYGHQTRETAQEAEFATRFDFDFYFGTLFNRWCAMACLGLPITVYGSGHQIKPFIHLEDAVESMIESARQINKGEYRVYNQLTEYVAIHEIALMIQKILKEKYQRDIEIKNISNPRVEREDQQYRFCNKEFMRVLAKAPLTLLNSIEPVIDGLMKHRERIEPYLESFMGVKS